MCCGCYMEYGSPTLESPEIWKGVDLVKQLYEFTGAGGNCHIVTDDWNLEDHSIEFCLNEVSNGGFADEYGYIDSPEQLKVEREILDLMKSMSLDERASMMGLVDGCFTSAKLSEPK
jgi:hypothetical protein